mmetsp:Transcript_155641/g.274909  ORF Transcript_155641/g.274909 Transcript_155641/m.274909 type:complete len:293 (+) Transcript_155641:47-925(+)
MTVYYDLTAEDVFEKQQQDPANNACFETGTNAPQWASASHGIYLSIGAAGIHRSLGAQISFVQSTTMDRWKPLHLKMMQLGGNERFRQFLEEQGVPQEMPIREKYRTRAAEWYRQFLRASAEETELPAPLAPGTGHLPSHGAQPNMLDKVFAEANSGATTTSITPEPSSSLQASKASTAEQGAQRGSCCKCCQTLTHAMSTCLVPWAQMHTAEQDFSHLDECHSVTVNGRLVRGKSEAHISSVKELPTLLFQSKGVRRSEMLQKLSTGKMEGFGSDSCNLYGSYQDSENGAR